MHDAFMIPEVLCYILGYLAEDTVRHPVAFPITDTQKAGRRALAALASTCHALSEPALDMLWLRLHSLKPFVLCLPTRKHEACMGSTSWTVVEAMPPLDEEEWSIVSRYATRVQELGLEYDRVSVKILRSLGHRTTPLLPNLRKLHWFYEDFVPISLIHPLLSPSLIHLCVSLDGGNHDSIPGFLKSYHTLCPNLKSLRFSHLCRLPHVTDAMSRAITHSVNLEALSCNGINEAALLHIAESRCLKKLSARLLNYQPDVLKRLAGYGIPDHTPFRNLRALELYIEDISSTIPYFRQQHQPFEWVSFEFRALPTPEILHELFTALGSTTRRGTLKQIRLFVSELEQPQTSPPVDFGVLSPLTMFNLRAFDVNLHNAISLNDDELVQLVQGWSELQTFHLNHGGGSDPLSSQMPTLKGMLHLLDRCRGLRHLGMCVDTRNIPLLSKDELLIRNISIKSLSLASSPIQRPLSSITQFLLDHFPSLVALEQWYHWTPFSSQLAREYETMWIEVNKRIREIRGWDSTGSAASSDDEMVKFPLWTCR